MAMAWEGEIFFFGCNEVWDVDCMPLLTCDPIYDGV